MKNFTQELVARGQADDDSTLNEVEEIWDKACDSYFQGLEAVKDQMPPGLRQRVEKYYLHDSAIRGMGRDGNSFVIMLQLDAPPHSLITFTYDLLAEPVILEETLPPCSRSKGQQVLWLYDEIEKLDGRQPGWGQSILMNNGWEVRLHFDDIQVKEVEALLPVPRNGVSTVGTSSVSMSA